MTDESGLDDSMDDTAGLSTGARMDGADTNEGGGLTGAGINGDGMTGPEVTVGISEDDDAGTRDADEILTGMSGTVLTAAGWMTGELDAWLDD